MAWFSGGLSQFTNITDQLSSFTKEVLTETTEEVEDPAAELQVAKKRVAELENLNQQVQNAYVKIKSHNEELNERLETAECQIATISQEYRKLLSDRDTELKRYKSENDKLREERKHFVDSISPNSPLKRLVDPFGNGGMFETVDISGSMDGGVGWAGDELQDFSDVVNSQGEINRLQSDLAKLKIECQHWKDTASKGPISGPDVNDSCITHKEIENVQASLQNKIDQHQLELSSLQSFHSENIRSLSLRHQLEVNQLQSLLEGSKVNEWPSEENEELRLKCLEDKQEILRLKNEIEELKRTYEEQKQNISSQNSHLKKDIDRLVAEKESLEVKVSEMAAYFDREAAQEMKEVKKERTQLHSQLDQLQTVITEHQDVISKLHDGCNISQSEIEQLKMVIDSLEIQVRAKESELVSLRQGRDSEQELVWLKHELDEKSHLLETSEKNLREVDQCIEGKDFELQSLKVQLQSLREDEITKMAMLEKKIIEERELLLHNLSEVKAQVQCTTSVPIPEEPGSKFKVKSASLQVEKEQLTNQLSAKDETISSLSASLEKCQTALQKKEAAFEEHTAAAEQTRQQLQVELEALSSNRASLTKQFQDQQDECAKYLKQLQQLKAHLLEVEERYTQEALEADKREAALKDKLAQVRDNIQSTVHHDALQSRYVQEQLSSAQDDLHAMVEQRDSALVLMANAQEQAHQNSIALQNLQSVLEQFQRDQSSDLAQALKQSQTELANAHHENQMLHSKYVHTESVLLEASQLVESQKHELLERERTVVELSVKIEELNHSLDENKKEIVQMSGKDAELVDKNLVKNLVLGYLHASDSKKPEVLHLVSKILSVSDDELTQALGKGGGWFVRLWGKPATRTDTQDGSLSQMFVKFLQSESLPKASLPVLPTAIPGYVDSRTDPDRPSLATAAVLRSQPFNYQPLSPDQPSQGKNDVPAQPPVSTSFQSTLLNSVLDS